MHSAIDLNALISAAGDSIIACDAQGLITLWNPASERIFGFTEAEVLGQSLDIIIPERQRQRHWDGYHNTMHTGVTRYATDTLRVPALHKDGHTISIAFTVALLPPSADGSRTIIAVIREETARFAEERKLRKEIGELQAKLRALEGAA
ncbi:MAG TPA: PAS domain-containing protein [Methylovirgula sp.]|jgi:PAS domain S-box-containing protein|nr:PAS domain-containing protein [Methylovirgula sp.]